MKNKILLINQGKTQNLGDKAINNVLIKYFQKERYEVNSVGFATMEEQNIKDMKINKKFYFIYKVKNYIPKYFIWKLKYHKKIKKYLLSDNIEYEYIIIGGGQLLKTKSVFPYILYDWVRLINKYKKTKIVLLSVGCDNKFKIYEKLIYKKSFKYFDKMFFRDKYSLNKIEKIFNLKAYFLPDVAFLYSNFYNPIISYKNKIVIMIYNYSMLKNHFGTNLDKKEYYEDWIKIMNENQINSNFEDVFLSYTTYEDKLESLDFQEYLKNNYNIKINLYNPNSVEDLINLFVGSKIIISGRMHALILGLSYQCKVVPYIVSNKIENFNEEYIKKNTSVSELKNIIINMLNFIKEK